VRVDQALDEIGGHHRTLRSRRRRAARRPPPIAHGAQGT
jgi:hypothetical protein